MIKDMKKKRNWKEKLKNRDRIEIIEIVPDSVYLMILIVIGFIVFTIFMFSIAFLMGKS